MTTIRVIDVETTGTDPETDAVCQLGWQDLEKTEGRDEWTFGVRGECMVNPGRPIPPEASAIHHIVDADVADAPPFADAISGHVRAISEKRIDCLAAHNSRFDQAFMPPEMRDFWWVDTYRAALRIWPEAPRHTNQVLRYWRGHIEIDGFDRHSQTHRAGFDAAVTATLLRDMLEIESHKQLVVWSREPALLPRLHFGKHAGKPFSEIPSGYLEWMLSKDFDEDAMHTAQIELERRAAE